MREYKKVVALSKEFIDKKNYKKVNSLKDKEEKIYLLKHLLLSKMKLMHLELELLLKNSKQIEDFEILLLKTSNLSHKITLLEHNLNEKDFKKILSSINDIKRRLPHV